jgi:D-glycero-D-manno-heptose 1,7-bisphosphate phosphatase
MTISGVFLDRDGVLNPHIPGGYLLSAADLILLPGVASSVRRLNDAGLPVIVISNQQGVGKGQMTLADLAAIEERMAALLQAEAGARVDRSYYCTELASVQSQRRKPGPGMLWEAAQDFGLDIAQTVFAGDSPTDIQAGQAAGVGATILLLSGGTRVYPAPSFTPTPDFVFNTLPQAVDWILGQ